MYRMNCAVKKCVHFGETSVVHVEVPPDSKMRRYKYGRPEIPQRIIPRPGPMDDILAALTRAMRLSEEMGSARVCIPQPPSGNARGVLRRHGGNARVAAGALCGDDEGWIGPKKWLMDTGSAVDLVSVHDIPAKWEKSILTGGPKIKLSTANGFMLADKRIPLQVGSFGGIEVEPFLLPSTPPVLSVGKRCMEEGYTCLAGREEPVHAGTQPGEV